MKYLELFAQCVLAVIVIMALFFGLIALLSAVL